MRDPGPHRAAIRRGARRAGAVRGRPGRARGAALSRAINRKQICDTLFYDTRTPAGMLAGVRWFL